MAQHPRRARRAPEEKDAEPVDKKTFTEAMEAIQLLVERIGKIEEKIDNAQGSAKEPIEVDEGEKELDKESSDEGETKERTNKRRGRRTTKGKGKEGKKQGEEEAAGKTLERKERGGKGDEEGNTDTRALSSIQTAYLKEIPKFKGGAKENPEDFLAFFEDVIRDARGTKGVEEADLKRYLLRVAQGAIEKNSEAETWLKEYRARQGGERGDWESFVNDFRNEFLKPEKRLEWNRSFLDRRQGKDESPQKYLTELREIAKLAKKSEEDILTQYRTCLDDKITKALAPLRLKKLKEVEEAAQAIWMEEQRGKDEKAGRPVITMAIRGKAEGLICHGCGGRGHMVRECPSAKNKGYAEGGKQIEERKEGKQRRGYQGKQKFSYDCHNCGKKGHKAKDCYAPKKETAKKTPEGKEEEVKNGKAGFVAVGHNSVLPFAEVTVGNVRREAMIDSGATDGAIVNEDIGGRITWKVKPSNEGVCLGGIMDGAEARWGEAIIRLGGKETVLPIGVTSALNDKMPILLGNGAMEKLSVVFDWKRHVITPEGGEAVPFVLKKVEEGAHMVYNITRTMLRPGEGKWIGIKAPNENKEAPILVEGMATGRGIAVLDGVSLIKDGTAYIPIKNYGEEEEELREGERLAKVVILKEAKNGDKGLLAYKDVVWYSKDPIKEAKEREEGLKREKERKLITDKEFEEWLEKAKHLTKAEKEWVETNLLKEFREIFMRKEEKPVMPIWAEYAEIRVEGNPRQDPIRYWTEEKEKKINEEVKKLEDVGILEDSNSPWRSEWVLVAKSNGGIRPTNDYRNTVNKSAIFDAFPTSRIDEQRRKMAGCDLYTTVDVASAFFHVGITFDSREPTAVRTPGNLKQFTRAPQGASVSGAMLARAISNTIMKDLEKKVKERTAIYVDEFMVGGKKNGDKKEESAERIISHCKDVVELFKLFKKYGYRISLDKFNIAKEEVMWVGDKYREGGVEVAEELLQSIVECKEPKTVTEVRSLMGFCTRIAESVPDFKIRTKALTKYQGEKGKVELDEEAKEAFEWIKEEAMKLKGKLMKIVEKNKGVKVKTYTDASKKGIGIVVMQDGMMVCCHSRTLGKREQEMAPIDRELMGLAEGAELVEKRFGIIGAEFYSDHEPLCGDGWKKLEVEPAKGRAKERANWVEVLIRTRPRVVYVPGLKNLADAPSRPPFVAMAVKKREAKEWSQKQWKDKELKKWFDYLEEGILPKDKKVARLMAVEKPNYDIVDGVLRRRRVPHAFAGKKEAEWLIMVPEDDKEEVMKEFHDEAGHAGGEQLVQLIHRGGMDWERAYSDCRKHREECEICGKHMSMSMKKGKLEPILKESLEGEVLHIDWIGPLKETKRGNKFIVLSITKKDKWPEATAYAEQNAENVVKHLEERIQRESMWNAIVSDRGSPFVNEAVEKWAEKAGVKWQPTTAKNPQANGEVESEVKNLKWELKVDMEEDEGDWDDRLGKGLQRLRWKIRKDSGMSAYEKRFGKPMRLPNHVKFGAEESREVKGKEREELMKEVFKKEDEKALKAKEIFDKSRKEIVFKDGDKVWLRIHEPESLGPKKDGPFVILEKVSDVAYKIGELGKAKLNNRHNVVNVKHLEPYKAKYEDEEEYKVEAILNHRRLRNGYRFKVKWVGGAVTEEKMDNFVDIVKGKKVWNAKLSAYARKNGITLI